MMPGKFIGRFQFEWLNEEWWMVLKSFTYITSDGERITPKKGFYTDGGSCPWFIRWFITQTVFLPAFTLHDWLYNKLGYPKWKADRILNEACYTLSNGQGIKAWFVYLGVLLFGWYSWREDQRKQKAKARQKKGASIFRRKLTPQ